MIFLFALIIFLLIGGTVIGLRKLVDRYDNENK